jgi:hypothetical protein
MTGKTVGRRRCCTSDAMPMDASNGRLCSNGKLSRGADALPFQGEPQFEHGARHCATFHGSCHAEKDPDGLCILRGADGVNQRGTPIAFFEGEDRWRAEADEQGRALNVYEVDPTYVGLDGPRTIVQGGPRDTRDNARKTLAAINERNRRFWEKQKP